MDDVFEFFPVALIGALFMVLVFGIGDGCQDSGHDDGVAETRREAILSDHAEWHDQDDDHAFTRLFWRVVNRLEVQRRPSKRTLAMWRGLRQDHARVRRFQDLDAMMDETLGALAASEPKRR